MSQNEQGSGSQDAYINPEAMNALLMALGNFQSAHPRYVPKLGDGVIWSEDGIRPRMEVFQVTAVVRIGGESWEATIKQVSDIPQENPDTHIVPAEHLARSADILVDMFVQLQSNTPSLSEVLGRPAKPQQFH